MVIRTTNEQIVKQAIAAYTEEIVGLNVSEWLGNEKNIALTNSYGDVAMFEHQQMLHNTVCGHYFFFSRGRQAITAGQQFLQELFANYYPEIIVGATPVDNRAALWMNRQLGFKEHGTLETEVGPCKFVMLTKNQWKEQNK